MVNISDQKATKLVQFLETCQLPSETMQELLEDLKWKLNASTAAEKTYEGWIQTIDKNYSGLDFK